MRAILLLAGLTIPLGLDRGLLAPPENPVTEEKIALGRRLFLDRALSIDGTVACAGCHQPERAFSDGRRVAVGIRAQRGTRNTPAIINRTYGRAFFWDGRTRTLEAQVLEPIQNAKEMGTELPILVERLRRSASYRSLFESAFGGLPDARFLSYALASFVRVVLSGNSRYDRYEAGDRTALGPREIRGLELFRGKARCAVCHAGSNLTDEDFHNTGVSWRDPPADPGRLAVTGSPEDAGKFKAPTLRDVALTAPYMHDGSIPTLEAVVEFYNRGGTPNPNLDSAIRPLRLTAEEKAALVMLLKSLTGESRVLR